MNKHSVEATDEMRVAESAAPVTCEITVQPGQPFRGRLSRCESVARMRKRLRTRQTAMQSSRPLRRRRTIGWYSWEISCGRDNCRLLQSTHSTLNACFLGGAPTFQLKLAIHLAGARSAATCAAFTGLP